MKFEVHNMIGDPRTMKYVNDLSENMRLEDRREVTKFRADMSVLDIVVDAVQRSTWCYCLTADDEVVAIWGIVIPGLMAGTGYPWALTTDLVEDYRARRVVMWLSRQYLDRMRHEAPVLVAMVDEEHVKAVRWLQWLGFSTDEESVVNGSVFRKATIVGVDSCVPQ